MGKEGLLRFAEGLVAQTDEADGEDNGVLEVHTAQQRLAGALLYEQERGGQVLACEVLHGGCLARIQHHVRLNARLLKIVLDNGVLVITVFE